MNQGALSGAPPGERSSLLTHIATTESVLLRVCVRT